MIRCLLQFLLTLEHADWLEVVGLLQLLVDVTGRLPRPHHALPHALPRPVARPQPRQPLPADEGGEEGGGQHQQQEDCAQHQDQQVLCLPAEEGPLACGLQAVD